ncbi:MAG: hypothetical protein WD036_07570 [Bauldia sp.]
MEDIADRRSRSEAGQARDVQKEADVGGLKNRIDRPRLLGDQQEIARRKTELSAPHILPLAAFAKSLREQGYGDVPDFDPWDGGTGARALFLLEKPGPQADASGFISRNNDDKTAENTFNFMNAAGIPRDQTCLWNVVPGWNGTRTITGAELKRGVCIRTAGLANGREGHCACRKQGRSSEPFPNPTWAGDPEICPSLAGELCFQSRAMARDPRGVVRGAAIFVIGDS